MEYYSALIEMSYQAMKRRGEMHINKWKKSSLKRLYTVWFQLYDILEDKTMETMKKIQWFPRAGWNSAQGIFRAVKTSVWYYKWCIMSLLCYS